MRRVSLRLPVPLLSVLLILTPGVLDAGSPLAGSAALGSPFLVAAPPGLVAGASGQEVETVPGELLRAMVGFNTVVIVGELSEDLDALLELPEGARAIGSIVYDDRTTAYVSLTGDAESAFTTWREQLLAGGWQERPERPRPGGFRAAEGPEPVNLGNGFCGPDEQYLSVSIGSDAGRTTARLNYNDVFPGMSSPCDRPMPQRGSRDELQQRMPVLDLPADELGAGGRGGSIMGGGRDSWWTGVELETERTAAAIAAGIAAQLEAEGWLPDLVTEGDRAAVRTWSRTFDDGFEALGSLVVLETVPGRFEATFRIRTPPQD